MKTTAILSLFYFYYAAALARPNDSAPADSPPADYNPHPHPREDVLVSNLTIFGKAGADPKVTSVWFYLYNQTSETTGMKCRVDKPKFPDPDKNSYGRCTDPMYSFMLVSGVKTQYALRVFHQLGDAVGLIGAKDILTDYALIGPGPLDNQSKQTGPPGVCITLDNDNSPIQPAGFSCKACNPAPK